MLPQDTMSANEVLVHMDGLSYEAYFKKVQELVGVLRNNWRQEQRVKTLKVAIQLSKLLADSSQPRLYAKKHRMITESLDEFGRLVHERVHSIASGRLFQKSLSSSSSFAYDDDDSGQQMRRDNNSNNKKNKQQPQQDDHLELAKDICRNWFLKVASIRELVPRFYIELAILKACDILFVQNSHTTSNGHLLLEQFFVQSLRRLSKAAWGFGNPIVALHARAYLCQVAVRLLDYRKSTTLSKSSQLFGGIILTNLNCCATLVRRLDINSVIEATGQQHQGTPPIQANNGTGYNPTVLFSSRATILTDPGGDLCIELVLSPIASILYMIVSKFDEGNDLKLGRNVAAPGSSNETRIEQHLQKCVQELLDNLAQGEQECCAYRRNVILSAICRSLPSELAPFRAQRLMYELRVGYDKWKHDEIQFEKETNTQNQQDNFNEAPKLVQIVIISFYSALTNLMIALDGCELSDYELLKFDNGSTTNSQSNCETSNGENKPPAPSELLSAAETMLNELGELYLIYEENQQPVGVHHLKCFKAILTYANHYVNEAAVDRLLRDYLARFGLRPTTRHNCQAGKNVNRSQHYHNRHRHQQQHAIHLLDIIKTLFTSRTNLAEFERILALSSFNQLFNCIQKDDHKLDAAKWILESMRANIKLNRTTKDTSHQDDPIGKGSSSQMTCQITNREMINFLLKLFQTINDTLSPLADQDELEHLSKLVVFYLDLILLGDIHDKLDFYLRCRSSMGNLHLVLEYLIRKVFDLPDAHRLLEKKRGARQNFLNGCLAFAFSTIPALHNNPLTRLDLYQLGCSLALERSSLSLADYYMKQIMATFGGLVQDSSTTIGGNENYHCNERPVLNQDQIERQLSLLLELMLKHQDHIDLKHKMALSELIKGSFARCSSLLQRLKHLNCIERYVNDDNWNDNNDV